MNRQHIPEHVHPRVHTHMKVGLTLFASVAPLTLWRWLSYTRARRDPGWGYLALAFAALALTLYQGSLGSRLVYEDGIGVTPRALRAPAARKSSGHRESPGHDAAKAESRSGGHGGH